MKPMMDTKLNSNKVTCIFLTEDGKYLLSGYKKGTLALWDMVSYTLVKIMDDVHKSEVTSAKIFNITDEEVVKIISSEDSGKVWCTDVSMRAWLGVSVYKACLYDQRMKAATSIAPFIPD
jgi:WD40 repeat protein